MALPCYNAPQHSNGRMRGSLIDTLLHLPHQGFSKGIDLSHLQETLADGKAVLWLEVTDPSSEELDLLRREFGFHELALEDATLPHQRPKVDEYDQFYFLVFYSVRFDKGDLSMVELDLFVGPNYLVAVHKGSVPEIPEGLRRWQRNDSVLGQGVGGLVYALLDSLVDRYFDLADQVAEQVAELEEEILAGSDHGTVQSVFALKKGLLALRRVLGPERDALNVLMRQDISLLDRRTIVYLRDVYDHLVRITDTVDLHSDLLTNALDVYLSSISNRLNQVMKTLTSVTIILMSVALIAGVYGMNFKNMPELEWPLGYGYALGLMVVVGAGLYLYLRRKDWI